MSVRATIERVRQIDNVCNAFAADRARLASTLTDVAKLESWASARRADLVRRLDAIPGSFPEADIAESTGCSLNAATKETDRSRTLGDAEAFAAALDAGDIRPGHVDALTKARNRLTTDQAEQLLDQQAALAERATTSSISAFEAHMRRMAKQLETEQDAQARLERQRRDTRLRYWVDPDDGMWCLSGRFDPLTGCNLARHLDDTVSTIFAENTPDTAPADPVSKQQHLNALALVRLVDGDVPAVRRPGNPIVVVDAGTTSAAASETGPELDWGLPVELPLSVLAEVFDLHDPDVVIVANGVVLHAPGNLNLGRSTRLANRAQRRALRGIYATCAIPGCATHYDRCKLHHVVWWRHGGTTDLDNLLPVCAHHHTRLHAEQWRITLGPNRQLHITLGDGRIMTTGPPQRTAA